MVEVWTAILAGIVSVLTLVFGWLKVRDEGRFKGVEQQLAYYQGKVSELLIEKDRVQKELTTYYSKYDSSLDKIKALEEEKDRLQADLDNISLHDAVIVADQTGKIIMANYEAAKLLKWNAVNLIGKPLDIIVPEAYKEAHIQAFKQAAESNSMVQRACILVPVLTRLKTEIPSRISIVSVRIDKSIIYIGLIRPVF